MDFIINEHNLQTKQIKEFNSKVKILLIDENNQILIKKHHDIYYFLGGKTYEDESTTDALIRILYQTTGKIYNINEFTFLTFLENYQKTSTKRNTLTQNYYYIAKFKGYSNNKTLPQQLELISIDKLLSKVKNTKNKHLELLTIIDYYYNNYHSNPKKLKRTRGTHE